MPDVRHQGPPAVALQARDGHRAFVSGTPRVSGTAPARVQRSALLAPRSRSARFVSGFAVGHTAFGRWRLAHAILAGVAFVCAHLWRAPLWRASRLCVRTSGARAPLRRASRLCVRTSGARAPLRRASRLCVRTSGARAPLRRASRLYVRTSGARAPLRRASRLWVRTSGVYVTLARVWRTSDSRGLAARLVSLSGLLARLRG